MTLISLLLLLGRLNLKPGQDEPSLAPARRGHVSRASWVISGRSEDPRKLILAVPTWDAYQSPDRPERRALPARPSPHPPHHV